ncbi:GNAT family N-acetyltransferase [Flocculibacter collagenilyticus]|uniref:GNAT family N-acetyltransferase n=1 Tax=Flocculibacter collagenilyticus TaxID=2744479 RepID=UPI0018F46280|nr:GNAT family N-acetyltransferase [Flocculibacter collagenilyticus]
MIINSQSDFSTERLSIEGCIERVLNNDEDFSNSVLTLLSKKVTKHLPESWQHIDSNQKVCTWLQHRIADGYMLSIRRKDTGEVIGLLFLHQNKDALQDGSLQIGYLLGDKHWGYGYASEMLLGLIAFCKKNKDINVLYAGVDAENVASIHILKKCGFTQMNIGSKGTADKACVYQRYLNLD